MKKIEFIPASKYVEINIPPPKPSKYYIPEYYKEHDLINRKNAIMGKNGRAKNLNVKSCMPFLDALTHGYIQETWTEIEINIDDKDNIISVHSAGESEIIGFRGNSTIINNHMYSNNEFHWKMPWSISTPKKYSVLITHPQNRIDLPFFTLSGIIDSDNFDASIMGQVPFHIKKYNKIILPPGTPMYQIIPIERETWKSYKKYFNEISSEIKYFNLNKFFMNSYKKQYWQKKTFK